MRKTAELRAVAIAAILGLASMAHAANPAIVCESAKLKEAAKYASCRLKAESKAVKKSETADFTKCETKFGEKWGKIETKSFGFCPSNGDEASMDVRIATDALEIATMLGGGAVSDCGNGILEAGEDCDFGTLGGASCTSLGLYGYGLACAWGCVFDTSACSETPPGSTTTVTSTTVTSTTVTSTTSTSTTSTTLPPGVGFDIDFQLDQAVVLGALQYDVDYSAAGGQFEGSGGSVSCTDLSGAWPIAFNDNEGAQKLSSGFLDFDGTNLTGPNKQLARCRFLTAGATPAVLDFPITVVDSADTGGSPVAGVSVSISAITPVP